MNMTINSDEAERLARQLVELTGEPLATVVEEALRERLEREQRKRERAGMAERLLAIGARYAALPDKDTRTPDEILGYDENGLPT